MVAAMKSDDPGAVRRLLQMQDVNWTGNFPLYDPAEPEFGPYNKDFPSGTTLVRMAAFLGKPGAMKELRENGHDLEASIKGVVLHSRCGTPLLIAVRNGHHDVAEYMIDCGADVNAEVRGFTPLALAAASGSDAFVRRLLSAGADPSKGSQHALCMAKGPEVTRLLAAHPSVTADVVGRALVRAIRRGMPIEVFTALLSADVDLKAAVNYTESIPRCVTEALGIRPKSVAQMAKDLPDVLELIIPLGADTVDKCEEDERVQSDMAESLMKVMFGFVSDSVLGKRMRSEE